MMTLLALVSDRLPSVGFLMLQADVEAAVAELANFLTVSIENLVTNKGVLQAPGGSVAPARISKQMARILRRSLKSEREQYLVKLLEKLDQTNDDGDELEWDYRRTRHRDRRQTHKIGIENQALRDQYDKLWKGSETIAWKRERKERAAKDSVRRQDQNYEDLQSVIDLAESTGVFLKRDVLDLRQEAVKMHRMQEQLLQQATNMCSEQLHAVIGVMVGRQQNAQNRRMAKLKEAIAAEKRKQEDLEHVSEAVLEAIWSVTPEGWKRPEVSSQDFPQKVGELRAFVSEIIETTQKKANDDLKAEIVGEVKGIRFGDPSEHITAVMDRYVQERVRAKKEECELALKEGEEKERRMRVKLDEALGKIHRLQGYISEETGLSDTEDRTDMWNDQKRKLDRTLESLSRGDASGLTLHSDTPSLLRESDSD